MYIDKLNDIVNEYNNKYHRNIKMKLVNITSSAYIDFIAKKKIKIKILSSKLVMI